MLSGGKTAVFGEKYGVKKGSFFCFCILLPINDLCKLFSLAKNAMFLRVDGVSRRVG